MSYQNKIVFIIKDKNILVNNSDFRVRHSEYISILKEKNSISFLLIKKNCHFLINTEYQIKKKFKNIIHVLFYLIKTDFSKIILQDTFFLSLLVNIIYKIKRKDIILQIHGELFSKNWLSLSYKNYLKFILSIANIVLCKKIRVVNNKTKEILLNTFKNKKISNIPIPILDYFEKKNFDDLKNYRFNIVYISELIHLKNPEFVIKICNQLTKLNLNYKMFIIGDGPLKTKVENMIEKFNLKKNIILLGKLEYREIKELYKKMHLTILTSKSESYSRVIIESFLNHTPVISTKSTGPLELLDKKYLFNLNQEIKIAKYILFLSTNKNELIRYMENIEKKYMKYNPRVYINQWTNFILK